MSAIDTIAGIIAAHTTGATSTTPIPTRTMMPHKGTSRCIPGGTSSGRRRRCRPRHSKFNFLVVVVVVVLVVVVTVVPTSDPRTTSS